MPLDQAIEKELNVGVNQFSIVPPDERIWTGREVREALKRIATLAQSPLMLKELQEKSEQVGYEKCWQQFKDMDPYQLGYKMAQEKTRRETLEEAASVCKIALRTPHDWEHDDHTKTCKDGCTYCCYAEGNTVGHNSALERAAAAILARRALPTYDTKCTHCGETGHTEKDHPMHGLPTHE
jgi:hypothetical protein